MKDSYLRLYKKLKKYCEFQVDLKNLQFVFLYNNYLYYKKEQRVCKKQLKETKTTIAC